MKINNNFVFFYLITAKRNLKSRSIFLIPMETSFVELLLNYALLEGEYMGAVERNQFNSNTFHIDFYNGTKRIP